MKKLIILVLLLFIAGCATEPQLKSTVGMPPDAPVEKIHVKGENCNWSPELIRVKKDTHVILEVESVDWDYNFNLTGYDLSFVIPKGKTVTAEFYASRTGEFVFGCYIEKGDKYLWGGMVGKIIVE